MEFPPAGQVLQSWSAGQITPPQSFTNSGVGALWKSWMSDSNLTVRLSEDHKAPVQSCAGWKDSVPGTWLTEDCYSALIRQFEKKTSLSDGLRIRLTEAEFRLGNYDEALRSAEQLRAANPHSGWAVYWQSKTHDAIAEQCFLKVGELNPDSARVHQMLAERYLKLSDYPKAKAEFENALRMAPGSADLHLGLGKVLSRTRDWPGAEKELRTTLDLAPQSAFAHYELGHVYVQRSMWPQAMAELRQVPDDSTVLLSARLDLAKAESEIGQTSDALKALLSVAALDQDGELYFRLAALYRQLGDPANAQKALDTFKQRRSASLETDTEEVGALEREQAVSRAGEPSSR
jgi:tetratricopeptide (TPR) repeat protein